MIPFLIDMLPDVFFGNFECARNVSHEIANQHAVLAMRFAVCV